MMKPLASGSSSARTASMNSTIHQSSRLIRVFVGLCLMMGLFCASSSAKAEAAVRNCAFTPIAYVWGVPNIAIPSPMATMEVASRTFTVELRNCKLNLDEPSDQLYIWLPFRSSGLSDLVGAGIQVMINSPPVLSGAWPSGCNPSIVSTSTNMIWRVLFSGCQDGGDITLFVNTSIRFVSNQSTSYGGTVATTRFSDVNSYAWALLMDMEGIINAATRYVYGQYPINFVIKNCTSYPASTLNVTLPTIKDSDLPTVGATAGTTSIQLNFAGCPQFESTTFPTMKVDFATGSAVNTLANQAAASAATGVYFQLLDTNTNLISNGGTFNLPAIMAGSNAPGYPNTTSFSYTMYARYYRASTVTPGRLQSTATLTFNYP